MAIPASAQERDERGEEAGLSVASEESGFDEEARIVYEAGVVAYREQRFENALEYFERAHELSGRPQMLFNIGLVADRLRRDERAVEAYEAFLREMPDTENRAQVEDRVRLLRDELDERERLAAASDADTRAEDDGGSGGSDVGAIVLLSIGGLAVGGAIAGAIWWADRGDVLGQCDERGCANVGVIETERNAAIGVTVASGVVGLASLVVGAIILASGDDDETTAAACGISPVGVSCAGRF